MAYFVKVIPPSSRARIHGGEYRHCRNGQGQENQDIGGGPTYWQPPYPLPGYQTLDEARQFMADLNNDDVGVCADCAHHGYV